jgi:UDP-N-acetylmuramoyl-L-alanyl-D-glutamate--2,6-diaminopimelate ligase
MMKLKELLDGWVIFDKDILVTELAVDSRAVHFGNLFIALAGTQQHGLTFVEQALVNGACAVIFDPENNGRQLAESIRNTPMIPIPDLTHRVGAIAARFYGNPSQFIDVIGITGTNGKTSCSQFLSQVLDQCGVIGTLGWGQWDKLNSILNTTPDGLTVQKILAALVKDKKQTVAMEVSSHGVAQGRVNGVNFKGAVFTNISRDHLDYHGTMEAYLEAKLELLKKPGLTFTVINLDDDYSDRIIEAVPEGVVIWGISAKGGTLGSGETVSAENIVHKMAGIEFDMCWRDESRNITVPLYGDFNTENILCVAAVMLAMGISLDEIANRIARIKAVTGRMECFGGELEPLVFVDYAHTPDALDKVLSSLRKHSSEALWVVFGCGGNRDTGKRPQMGTCAEQWADHVIVTDDNPRFESGPEIINDILSGCLSDKVEVIQDRQQAIQSVIARAANRDCIVIAGKGHEDYQEINGARFPFNDRQVVIEALKMRAR